MALPNLIQRTSSMRKKFKRIFFPDLLLEDVEDSLRELGRNNFLNNLYADDTVYTCRLSDFAIATMENLPKETFNSITDFIAKFIP